MFVRLRRLSLHCFVCPLRLHIGPFLHSLPPHRGVSGRGLIPKKSLASLTGPCLGQHNRQPTPYLNPPGIAQPIPAGSWVVGVQHVLVGTGFPCAANVRQCLDIVRHAYAVLGFNAGDLEIMHCFSSVTFAQPMPSNTKNATLRRRTALNPKWAITSQGQDRQFMACKMLVPC